MSVGPCFVDAGTGWVTFSSGGLSSAHNDQSQPQPHGESRERKQQTNSTVQAVRRDTSQTDEATLTGYRFGCYRQRLATLRSSAHRQNTTAVRVTITFRTDPTPEIRRGNDWPVPPAGRLSQSRGQAQPTSTLDHETTHGPGEAFTKLIESKTGNTARYNKQRL